jgi:hypothetical protein
VILDLIFCVCMGRVGVEPDAFLHEVSVATDLTIVDDYGFLAKLNWLQYMI